MRALTSDHLNQIPPGAALLGREIVEVDIHH
jgi:hypothetical protein